MVPHELPFCKRTWKLKKGQKGTYHNGLAKGVSFHVSAARVHNRMLRMIGC